MRMRSPSSAPPLRRRVGSTEITAMRMSGKCCRKRFSSSSVTELLPAPPVPVRPMTGVLPPASCHCLRRFCSSPSLIALLLDGGQHIAERHVIGIARSSAWPACRLAVPDGARHQVFDHRHQAHLHAVVRVVDALDAVGLQFLDFIGRDGAATAAEHADMAGAGALAAGRSRT